MTFPSNDVIFAMIQEQRKHNMAHKVASTPINPSKRNSWFVIDTSENHVQEFNHEPDAGEVTQVIEDNSYQPTYEDWIIVNSTDCNTKIVKRTIVIE